MKVPSPLRLTVVGTAVVLAAIGVIYVVMQCEHIPWPLPGREARSTDHRFGFAAASFVALLLLPWVIWRAEEVRTPLCF